MELNACRLFRVLVRTFFKILLTQCVMAWATCDNHQIRSDLENQCCFSEISLQTIVLAGPIIIMLRAGEEGFFVEFNARRHFRIFSSDLFLNTPEATCYGVGNTRQPSNPLRDRVFIFSLRTYVKLC